MGSTRHPLVCAILAALLAVLTVDGGGATAQKNGKKEIPAVVVTPAEIRDLRESAGFTGRLTAIQKVDIRARVAGFVQAVSFTEGAKVKKGDVLYRIEDDAYRAAVEEMKGSIAAAEAQRELARLQRDRKATLVERETVAQSELDIALANLGKIEGEIERLKAQLDQAELQLSYTRITAPFDGTIGLSTVDVGAFVGPQSDPLTSLTRLDPMQVEFSVATAQLLEYRERQARGEPTAEANVQLTLPNETVYPRKGRIDFIDAEVAPGTDTVTVRARFENPKDVLLDGALVNVTLERGEPEPVLSVPRRAVQRDQTGAFVLVVDPESKVKLRRVEVARTTDGHSVIASGLKEGELVITEGINKVRPGIIVDAAPAAGG